MPFSIRKVRNRNCYSVKNTETGRIHSHCATRANAVRQIHLLRGIEHGWKPKSKGRGMPKLDERDAFNAYLHQYAAKNQLASEEAAFMRERERTARFRRTLATPTQARVIANFRAKAKRQSRRAHYYCFACEHGGSGHSSKCVYNR